MFALRKEKLRLREGVQALTATGRPVLGPEFSYDHDLRFFSLNVSPVMPCPQEVLNKYMLTPLSLDFCCTGPSFKFLGRTEQGLYI